MIVAKRSVRIALPFLFFLLPVGACTFVVGADNYKGGCPADQKPCDTSPGQSSCVSKTDWQYGCASQSCVPCTLPHVASHTCLPNGQCGVSTCLMGWRDCNNSAADGCEVNLTSDVNHCNDCNTDCTTKLPAANAISVRCASGICKIDRCDTGYLDCDSGIGNGCETPMGPNNCGKCGPCTGVLSVCNNSGGTYTCEAATDGGT